MHRSTTGWGALCGALAAAVSLTCARAPSLPVDTEFAGCDACHQAEARDLRGAKHFANSMRCTTCHGPSKAHRADRSGATPPDIVFSGVAIDYRCSQCHQDDCRHAQTEGPLRAGVGRKTCADCHHAHKAQRVPPT